MQLKHFFQLIRWKNLVLIILMQFLIKLYFFEFFNNNTSLSYNLFGLLVFTTIIITASGYIINDVFDIKTDLINKPKRAIVKNDISISRAKRTYYALTFIGLTCGITLSIVIDKPLYSLYFVIVIILLYMYSKFLKGKLLIGNILVSLLLSFSILILILFDFSLPEKFLQWNSYHIVHKIIFIYALCAFLLNMIREIVKDIEDVNGDYNQHLKTFPIVFGRERAKKSAIIICIIALSFFLLVIFNQFKINSIALFYLLVFVFIPLLYFCIKLYQAETKTDYSYLSKLLKIIILTGVISIPIISNYFINAN